MYRVGKICKQLSNGKGNELLATGNLQLA